MREKGFHLKSFISAMVATLESRTHAAAGDATTKITVGYVAVFMGHNNNSQSLSSIYVVIIKILRGIS